MKKKIRIDLNQIMEAFDMHSDEITYYLNIETGNIAMYSNISGGFDENGNEIKDRDSFYDKKYKEIPGTFTYEAFKDVERFIETIEDDRLKQELELSPQVKSSVPHFKNILSYYPKERDRWLQFKEEQVRERIQNWLDKYDIEIEQ